MRSWSGFMNAEDTTANQAITPTRQEVVSLFDRHIVAVSLPDGRIAATLARLCDALGLTQNSQVRRIRMDDVLADELVAVSIETSSGVQTMGVLTAWAIPLWLTGIQTRKIADEKRAAILAFKKQAANVLYEHFSQLTLPPPPPTTLAPSEPIMSDLDGRFGPDFWQYRNTYTFMPTLDPDARELRIEIPSVQTGALGWTWAYRD